jgi:hypothetical protein
VSFVHDDPELIQLLRLVERETGIDAALIEKDYWIKAVRASPRALG